MKIKIQCIVKTAHIAKEKSNDMKNRSRVIAHNGHGYKTEVKRLVGYIGKVQYLSDTIKSRVELRGERQYFQQ